MTGHLRAWLGAGVATAAIGAAGAAYAGGGSGAGCNCAPPPPSCNCSVPSGHQVTVPGVSITPPSVYVNAPTLVVSAPSVEVQTTSVAIANASASASANGSAYGSAYSNVLANAVASGIYNGGGGSSWYTSEGSSGYIPNLQVEGVEAGQARRVCAEMRSTATMVAVQAVCLDDKAIPHPASQVEPEREVLPVYEGEVFRCIAGTRMQYTLADFNGQANFDHGQTITCQKGEALYHSAGGGLACHAQRPARDCNERSLLRRYGAGIKVLRMARAQECAVYKTETASSGGGMTMVLDGGVGGVAH